MKCFMTEDTKKNTNFDFFIQEIKPITEYGIKEKQYAVPYARGEEKELIEELEKIEIFLHFAHKRELTDVLKHMKNINETIELANNNRVLDEVELFEIKNFLLQLNKLERILKNSPIILYNDLKPVPIPGLHELLDPAGEGLNTFYIYNEYSEKLTDIRYEKSETEKTIRRMKKEIKEELQNKYNVKFNLKDEVSVYKSEKEKMEKLLAEKSLRALGESYLSVIFTVKSNDKIDALENKLACLLLEEEKEEFEIRKRITREIKNNYDILLTDIKAVGRIDYLTAKANFAVKSSSVKPYITDSLEITIRGGRSLKLEKTLRDKGKVYTPIDLSLKSNVTCITGANMGGKTVTLRMLGQIAAAAAYGIFVPCEYAKICIFDNIYISVGDDQSIEKGLSTFGAEIVNLKEALERSEDRSLILIDELAGGTNPREGYAITKAVVDYLKKRDCITVLTTHYDNIANDEEIQNLQVSGLKIPDNISEIRLNNINQISDYMDYRLTEVKNSSSIPKDALKIAGIAGINEDIIKTAEGYI